jgi:8-oxo-dGTP pyrophosphatase MutT (NUDIX family)
MTHSRAAIVLFVRHRYDEPLVLAVTNRAFGGIALPGGKADEGEDMRRAAQREVKEETGITIIPVDLTLLAKGDSVRPGSVCEVHLFYARHAWGEPKDVEAGTEHSWVTMSDLLARSPFKDFYERWLPDGVWHLRATLFANDATAPPDSTRIAQPSDLIPDSR